jgi:hypothetical protein
MARFVRLPDGQKVDYISRYKYLSFIERYAKEFGQDPDEVYHKPWSDVMVWIFKWKDFDEYQERYNEIDKALNQNTK